MKALERKYSKTERIVAKAKFSAWAYAKQLIVAIILGGAVGVAWAFDEQVATFFRDKLKIALETAALENILKWILLGVACFVLLLVFLQAVAINSKELIVTENKVVMRFGIFSVRNIVLPLTEIRIVESEQNLLQRLVRTGNLVITSDAEKPFKIKGISEADRLARRIMRQVSFAVEGGENKKLQLQLAGYVPSAGRRNNNNW